MKPKHWWEKSGDEVSSFDLVVLVVAMAVVVAVLALIT